MDEYISHDAQWKKKTIKDMKKHVSVLHLCCPNVQKMPQSNLTQCSKVNTIFLAKKKKEKLFWDMKVNILFLVEMLKQTGR